MNSRQVILGNQNVQIHDASGATVRITYNGSTRLVPLDPALIPIGPNVVHPTRLLRARAGIIPFTAHREVLDDLRSWCHNGAPFGIRLVGGRGGAGKTRLGVQLCCEMREHRWLTGLLARTTDEAALEALVTAETARLVVIDYAEARVDVLSSLMPMLGSHACPTWLCRSTTCRSTWESSAAARAAWPRSRRRSRSDAPWPRPTPPPTCPRWLCRSTPCRSTWESSAAKNRRREFGVKWLRLKPFVGGKDGLGTAPDVGGELMGT